MADDDPNASIRLRESGVGVVIGGLGVSWISFVFAPITTALLVIGIAIAWLFLKPPIGNARLVALGIAIVGVIALIESSPLGLGIDPLIIGVVAIAFGMVDIVIGLTTHRLRQRS